MKNLILAALCLLAFSTKAQVQQITVSNWSNCDVYFVLDGCPNAMGCSSGNLSAQFTFVPGQQQTFDGTAIGLAAGDNIVVANLPDADATIGCTVTTTGQVSDACFGAASSIFYMVVDNTCNNCAVVNAIWTSTGPGTANLDFF